jgi:predicted HicB family RNase H-like nuclease
VGRRKPDENVTLRLDPDVVTWARVRALLEGTSMNRVVARLLADYARVPQRWLDGLPPPWDEDPEG